MLVARSPVERLLTGLGRFLGKHDRFAALLALLTGCAQAPTVMLAGALDDPSCALTAAVHVTQPVGFSAQAIVNPYSPADVDHFRMEL